MTRQSWSGAVAALCGMFACAFHPALLADESDASFYVGVGGGEARHVLPASYYNDDRFMFPASQDLRQSDSAYTLYGGYRANPYFAIEANVSDYGASDRWQDRCPAEISCPASVDFSPYQERVSIRSAGIALVAILPLRERLELFAKLGVTRSRIKRSIVHQPVGASNSGFEFYDTSRMIATGVSYVIHPRWALRLQWDRIEAPFENPWFTGDTDTRAWTLSIEHRFDPGD